jgi:hypothetical protein
MAPQIPQRSGRPGQAGAPLETPKVTVLGLLLGSGPRFARDALGPVLVFYVGWKLLRLTARSLAPPRSDW